MNESERYVTVGEFSHERQQRRARPELVRCSDCQLPYYQTSAPHVCAGGIGAKEDKAMTKIYPRESRQTKRHIHTCMFCGQSGTELSDEQHHSLLAERERLREALHFQRDALNDLCDEGLSLLPSVHAKLANMRDDVDVALNDQKGVAGADQKGGER